MPGITEEPPMPTLYHLPRRFHPIFAEGQQTARIERLSNPDERTRILDQVAQQRAERDRQVKIATTMQIARESTATRSARCRPAGSSPSLAAPPFEAAYIARWQRSKGEPTPAWWQDEALREANAIVLLAAAGRLPRRRAA
jgi:hypothetical protein